MNDAVLTAAAERSTAIEELVAGLVDSVVCTQAANPG